MKISFARLSYPIEETWGEEIPCQIVGFDDVNKRKNWFGGENKSNPKSSSISSLFFHLRGTFLMPSAFVFNLFLRGGGGGL